MMLGRGTTWEKLSSPSNNTVIQMIYHENITMSCTMCVFFLRGYVVPDSLSMLHGVQPYIFALSNGLLFPNIDARGHA